VWIGGKKIKGQTTRKDEKMMNTSSGKADFRANAKNTEHVNHTQT
jgi:hypothetical protein